jgi:NodT family efflux transporter outer membrane factor (OMF) lipoprotein
MHPTRTRLSLALLLALGAAGCATTQADRYARPALQAPAHWQVRAAEQGWPDARWWSAFGSPELDALVAQAQEANHDLRTAAARVDQARANAAAAAAGQSPVASVGFGGDRSKDIAKSAGSTFSLGPQVAYEVDLWGRRRDAASSGNALLLASEFDREAIRLQLTADVANAYFAILSLNDRLRVAQENLALARRLQDLLAIQQEAGRTTSLELERQRSLVASTEAAIPALRQQRAAARGVLAVLLGRTLDQAPDPQGSLQALKLPATRGGVPSQLVERRPDIRRAEASLEAANADVGAARGAVLPNFTLRALGGAGGGALGSILGAGGGFYTLASALAGTLFDGGALQSRVDLAQAQKVERVEQYLQSVVTSFQEVEDALAGIEQFALQEDLLAAAAKSAREAYRLTDIRYRAGAESYFNVLDAQRTQLAAESAIDQVRLARFTATTALYRALGGGWDGQSGVGLAQAPREHPGLERTSADDPSRR